MPQRPPTLKEVTVKAALHRLKRKIPYGWDLNIYRGCQHGCRYCYARYTAGYLDSRDFAGEIFVKTNIVEALERELASPRWKPSVINLGGVTASTPCGRNIKYPPAIPGP